MNPLRRFAPVLLLLGGLAQAKERPPLPLPASGPEAWTAARGAVEDGDWDGALQAARDTLKADDGHAGAKLVEGLALHHLREWEPAMSALHQVEDDPDVGALARQQIQRYDNRWRRDQLSLSVGLQMAGDRGLPPNGLKPAFAAQFELPVAWRFNLRADLATAWATQDQLEMKGPLLGLMAVYHQPLGLWALDGAVGPTLWTGRSGFWEQAQGGPFPGLRVAVGGSMRPLRNLGFRMEGGWGATRGTRPMINAWSSGVDLRLMLTGYFR